MNNISAAFILSFFAGISTLIGAIVIFIKSKNTINIICSSLSFSSGVMLSLSILELLPESLSYFNGFKDVYKLLVINLCLLFGFTICYFFDRNISNDNNLYKVGLLSMIAIIIHNIPEGIITFITTVKDLELGFSLAIAIAFHNIPEGISISLPIYYSTGSKYKAFFYTFVSGISELMGAIMTYLFLSRFINNYMLGLLLSLTAGIMIYISLIELLPSSFNYKNIRLSIISFLFGFLLVIFNLLLY